MTGDDMLLWRLTEAWGQISFGRFDNNLSQAIKYNTDISTLIDDGKNIISVSPIPYWGLTTAVQCFCTAN